MLNIAAKTSCSTEIISVASQKVEQRC